MPRAQIKDEKTYTELRKHGESKEKSARIANAAAGSSRSKVGRKGGKSGSYDDWSKQEPRQAGAGNRHQGPVDDDEGGTDQSPSRPLIRYRWLTTRMVLRPGLVGQGRCIPAARTVRK